MGAGSGGVGISCSNTAWTTWGSCRVMSRPCPAWTAQNTSRCSNTTTPKPQGLRRARICRQVEPVMLVWLGGGIIKLRILRDKTALFVRQAE